MRKNIQHIQLVKSEKSKVESNQTNFHTAEDIDLKKTYSKVLNLSLLAFTTG